MKKLQWTTGIFLAFCVIAAWLITSFEAAMYSDFDFYRKEYEKYEVLEDLDMSMDDVMYVTEEMMAYLRGDSEELSVVTEVEGILQDFFNEQDRFHMGEVRDLFTGGLDIRKASCAGILFCLLLLILTKADVGRILPRSYHLALCLTGAAALALGIAAAVDFNALFVAFHHVFFDNDLWLFDPAQDYMIRMLPEGLFFDMVVRIGKIFIGGLLILLALSLIPGIWGRIRKND